MSKTDEYREALESIYRDARHPFSGDHGTPETAFVAGECRWCKAPPPTEDSDHDVACPAAKAGYALELPGYRDWLGAARKLARMGRN